MDPKASLAAVARASTEAAVQAGTAAQPSPAAAQAAAPAQAPAAPAQPAAAPAQAAAAAPAASASAQSDAGAAVTAAKQRIAAILALPEAATRAALAQEIALSTDLSVEQAKSMLSKSPEEKAAPANAFASAMAAQGNPSLGASAPPPASAGQADAAWADSIAKANERFGAKRPTRH